MERRAPNQQVAVTITKVMEREGVSLATLSEATDISTSDLRDRLDSKSEFTFDEVAAVGGFFRCPTASFFQGVAA